MDQTVFKTSIVALWGLWVCANISVYSMENNNRPLGKKGIIGKVLAALATSNVMHHYNKFCAKTSSLLGIPASEEMQLLGKEAQTAVGIPAERHVPIQYISGLDASAKALDNTILIGEEFMSDQTKYGVKRCNMFHEAVHIKYHDDEFNGALFLSSLLGTSLVTKMFVNPQGKLKLLYILALLVGHYLGRALQGKFESYRERRADIEGHYATQCYQCVTEKIEDIQDTYALANDIIARLDHNIPLSEEQSYGLAYAKKWIESKKRYLSIEENQMIADELRQCNRVCAFHEQSS